MSHYGLTFPEFFTGETGKRIALEGGSDAQILGVYLTANRCATMLGLYPLSLAIAQAEIRSLSTDQLLRAIGVLQRADFARFDEPTETVWVLEMARIRLQLAPKQPLKENDARIKTIQKLYDRVLPNPFLGPFHEKYRRILHLGKRRRFEGEWRPPLGSVAIPTDGAIEGPPNAPRSSVTGTGTETVQGSEIRKIDQEDQDHAARLRAIEGHLQTGAHAYLEANPRADDGAVLEAMKTVAAKCKVDYRYGGEYLRDVLTGVRAKRDREAVAV